MALMTATMNITGSAFYPSGGAYGNNTATITVTPYTGSVAGTVYTATVNTSSTGTITAAIPISTVANASNTTVQVYVTDNYTGVVSNVVTISLTIITVNPVLVGPTGGITLVNAI